MIKSRIDDSWKFLLAVFTTTATTTTVLRPFVGDYPGEPVPKKHSPTHHPDHHPTFISFFHLPWSIASNLFKLRAWQSFCTTSVQILFGLPLSGALHLIFHTFLHPISEYIPHPLLYPPTPPTVHPLCLSMTQRPRYRPEIPSLSTVYQPSGHHEHNPLPQHRVVLRSGWVSPPPVCVGMWGHPRGDTQ